MPEPIPDLGLSDKVAIVTGGTRGLGRAIAEALLSAGCQVAICGRLLQMLQNSAANERT